MFWKVYPDGSTAKHRGQLQLFLAPIKFPNNLRSITFYSHGNDGYSRQFYSDDSGRCIGKCNSKLLKKSISKAPIRFVAYLEILNIEYNNQDNQDNDKHKTDEYVTQIQIHQKYNYEWYINDRLLHKFKNTTTVSQEYYSRPFDINSNWCLVFEPYNKKGYSVLWLKLRYLYVFKKVQWIYLSVYINI